MWCFWFRPSPATRGLVAVCATVCLIGAAPDPSATPRATTSRECPSPAVETNNFLRASALDVPAPRGELSLVPVTREATRERGLMCVVRLPPGKGMLFVFAGADRDQSFWMKNTLVGLDMVFVTAAGTVSSIAADIPPTPDGTPDDTVARRSGFGRFVIELGAGDAARHAIVRGTKLTFPALNAAE